MICFEIIGGEQFLVDIDHPISISIPIGNGSAPNAFHLPSPEFRPFRMGDFVGSVEAGGPVQCEIVTIAPHGNGTHTECIGHIAGSDYVLTDCLRSVFCMTRLVTVTPRPSDKGLTVMADSLEDVLSLPATQALIIRTTPCNDKTTQQWSGSNPPFIHPDAMTAIVHAGIQHLLVDLPSVDAEEDGGALQAHHIFWQWPHAPRVHCTITEMVYVPQTVADGLYGIQIGAAPFVSDAAPSSISVFRTILANSGDR